MEKIKIRFLKSVSGNNFFRKPGDISELDPGIAQDFLKNNLAEIVIEENINKPTDDISTGKIKNGHKTRK